MSNDPIVYLHIGTQKTGTTALQQVFHDDQDKFLENGILYPKTGRKDLAQHQWLASSLSETQHPYYPGTPDDYKDEFANEVIASNVRKILISSELLSDKTCIHSVREFFNKFLVKVIVYIRRPDNYVLSRLNQAIKSDFYSGKISEFIENYEIDTYGIIQGYADVFGRENVIVRPYEVKQFVGGDLLSDFISILEIDADQEFSIRGKKPKSTLKFRLDGSSSNIE